MDVLLFCSVSYGVPRHCHCWTYWVVSLEARNELSLSFVASAWSSAAVLVILQETSGTCENPGGGVFGQQAKWRLGKRQLFLLWSPHGEFHVVLKCVPLPVITPSSTLQVRPICLVVSSFAGTGRKGHFVFPPLGYRQNPEEKSL